ncbi:MAG: LPS-assembly protein LptD [Thermoanaerobaculia bacterium]|nr:LPS-assembly protein LptD [Thermoanaerobaculia bacterium]
MGAPGISHGPQTRLSPARRPVAAAFGVGLAFLLSFPLLGQSSFESDPFGQRFRERAQFELPKFRVPEKGTAIRIQVPEGEGGRLSLLTETSGEAVAPPGKTVEVEYQDIKLAAKKVRVDYKEQRVSAEGDVVLEQGKNRIRADQIDFDLKTKTGFMTNGIVDVEGGMHLRADSLAKVGARTFTLSGARLTACDGDDPAWEFRFSSGRVTLEDYARLKKVVFRLGGVPLIYTPYLLWPAMRERASGFMIPAIGYSTNRGGFLGLSYFWAIGRSVDTTFFAELYTKRFLGLGTEVRARPSQGTTVEANYFAVRDEEQDGGWGYKTRGRITADDLAPGLRGVVTWLNFSDLEFFQEYERDFALSSMRSIKSEGFLTYTRDPVALNFRLDREEALYEGRPSVISERRPVLEARLRPTPLLGQTFFVEAEGQAGILRVDRGPNQPVGSYERFDIFPRVSIPLSFVPWLAMQIDGGYRLTSYGKSLSSDGSQLVDEPYTRSNATAGVHVAGPSFSRIFEDSLGPYVKLKHIIEPRFDYEYSSEPNDIEKTPVFDQVDSVVPVHSLKYALVQRLLAKQKQGSSTEIASLEISQTHYFRSPYGSSTPPPGIDPEKSPIDFSLRVNATQKLNVDGRVSYTSSASQVTAASLSAGMNLGETQANISLFHNRPVGAPEASTQIRLLGGAQVIPRKLRLDIQGAYDLSQTKLLELRTLVTYQASCFKILFEFRDLRMGTTTSRDFRVGLNLKNIGSFLDFPVSLP